MTKEKKRLIDLIRKHDKAYHHDNNPIISDAAYDILKKKLKHLEESSMHIGYLAENSKFKKVKHDSPMLSLANAFEISNMMLFDKQIKSVLKEKFSYIAEMKVDGLSLSLTYLNGTLVAATTRGDGHEGEDVTRNAFSIMDIPHFIENIPSRIEIRGEVYISRKDFLAVNKECMENRKKPFANPRNAAAGSLRQLDVEMVRKRRLRFIPHETTTPFNDLDTQSNFLDAVRKMGFNIGPYITTSNLNDIKNYYNKIIKTIRAKLPYDIDGLVIKVNEFNHRKMLVKDRIVLNGP